jgi:hypothetical protein
VRASIPQRRKEKREEKSEGEGRDLSGFQTPTDGLKEGIDGVASAFVCPLLEAIVPGSREGATTRRFRACLLGVVSLGERSRGCDEVEKRHTWLNLRVCYRIGVRIGHVRAGARIDIT